MMFVGCSDGSSQSQATGANVTNASGEFSREVLPVPDPIFPKITELDARNSTAPPPFSVTAPEARRMLSSC